MDDGSNDGTSEYLKTIDDKNVDVLFHNSNYGKGKAIQTALKRNFKRYNHNSRC